ncbi:hypothetical protein QBC33DRAFT_587462 [Phialemonium atrogriseum]|uniref:Uncharacterized protein n=1 Tax=Phialemonium atrogriseum TaxID=1093897 RepID=A0AAJ0C1R5_9PEZI|nr:uncharacterized protein QBC33DRAFT_587462 [Phialemonium atrogriseum]KAK1767134.1 hypothetical protein QBC33DRAFT_587462 [Phialemonium atrogriseum]
MSQQQHHDEEPTGNAKPKGPGPSSGRSAASGSAQAQQASRYLSRRQPIRVRPSNLRRARGPQLSRTVTAEGALPSTERSESPAAEETWAPSLVIGSSLGSDLSTIQLAERKITQWRAILQYHQENLPDAVGPIQAMLDAAIAERNQLDDSEANIKPRSALASTAQAAIEKRVSLLRSTLASSTFAPEAANIRAAIAGYATGAIPYSAAFTLIYAGRIVDTSPSYADFSADRPARLDRYAAAHGPGWLWFEPPLADGRGGNGGGVEFVKKACALNNPPSRRAGLGGGYWSVTMGFRRRLNWVSRGVDPGVPAAAKKGAAGSSSRRRASADNPGSRPGIRTAPDPSAPRVFFSMHLDSGASKPTLYLDDFKAMGIDPDHYAAQSAVMVHGVLETLQIKMFEVDVGIYGGPAAGPSSTTRSLVPTSFSPPARVWPPEPDAQGATHPVLLLPGPLPATNEPPDCNRLSGMLPFYATYLSSVPGTHTIWLGEDRRDVLGAARMPGQMRYAGFETARSDGGGGGVSVPNPLTAGHPPWMGRDLGTPDRIVFEHEMADQPGTWVRDEDMGPGRSLITLNSRAVKQKEGEDGGGGGEEREGHPLGGPRKAGRVEPRRQARQTRALRDDAAKEEVEEPESEEARKKQSSGRRVKRRRMSKS